MVLSRLKITVAPLFTIEATVIELKCNDSIISSDGGAAAAVSRDPFMVQ